MSSNPIGSVSDSDADSESDPTNERTDELTEKLDTAGYQETAVDAGARIKDSAHEFTTIGDVLLAGGLWRTNERHEVTRRGEREPIPSHVRAAVWYRDRGKCADCHPEYPVSDVIHLDHIKPWSAGGTDTTDNLRLLCERHNLERSNYIDSARPKRPATWWCHRCYDFDKHTWDYSGPLIVCPVHGQAWTVDKVRCRVARYYAMASKRNEEPQRWHERSLLTSFTDIAYCAHCDAPGMTGYVL